MAVRIVNETSAGTRTCKVVRLWKKVENKEEKKQGNKTQEYLYVKAEKWLLKLNFYATFVAIENTTLPPLISTPPHARGVQVSSASTA